MESATEKLPNDEGQNVNELATSALSTDYLTEEEAKEREIVKEQNIKAALERAEKRIKDREEKEKLQTSQASLASTGDLPTLTEQQEKDMWKGIPSEFILDMIGDRFKVGDSKISSMRETEIMSAIMHNLDMKSMFFGCPETNLEPILKTEEDKDTYFKLMLGSQYIYGEDPVKIFRAMIENGEEGMKEEIKRQSENKEEVEIEKVKSFSDEKKALVEISQLSMSEIKESLTDSQDVMETPDKDLKAKLRNKIKALRDLRTKH